MQSSLQRANPLFWIAALSFLVVSRSLLVTLSKTGAGYSYDPGSVVMITEVMKFLLATAFLMHDESKRRSVLRIVKEDLDQRVAALYIIPALLYAIQNLIVFRALVYLAPPTFELFSNLKIVTTAIVFRFAMNQQLNQVQWAAVFLLFLGTVLGTLSSQSSAAPKSIFDTSDAAFLGFLLCLTYSILSAIAGIYTEKLLKGSRQSTHLQNMEIYFWSVIVNYAIGVGERGSLWPVGGYLRGYTLLTWTIVLNGAVMGQCVSFVMKYSNNMVKVFASCTALFISTFLSVLFTDFQMNLLLMIGFLVAVTSLYLYFGPHNDILRNEAKNRALQLQLLARP